MKKIEIYYHGVVTIIENGTNEVLHTILCPPKTSEEAVEVFLKNIVKDAKQNPNSSIEDWSVKYTTGRFTIGVEIEMGRPPINNIEIKV